MPRREQQYKAFTAACNWINSHNSSFMIQWLAWPGTHRLSGSLYSVPLWLGGSRRPHLKLRLWQLIMHYILMPSSHQPYGSIFSWESSSLKSHSRRMDGRGSFLWISWAMCFWCFPPRNDDWDEFGRKIQIIWHFLNKKPSTWNNIRYDSPRAYRWFTTFTIFYVFSRVYCHSIGSLPGLLVVWVKRMKSANQFGWWKVSQFCPPSMHLPSTKTKYGLVIRLVRNIHTVL